MHIELKKIEEVENRLDLLCKATGHALWDCQGLEQILAKYYSVAFKLSDSPSAEQVGAEFENSFSHPAGRLIGLLKQAAGGKEVHAVKLEAFVAERNWLAHKMRRTDLPSLFSESDFSNLLKRVLSISNEAKVLTEAFNELMIDHFVSLGVQREHIESELAKELSKPYMS